MEHNGRSLSCRYYATLLCEQGSSSFFEEIGTQHENWLKAINLDWSMIGYLEKN
jgi:hypothetical protein